MAIIELRCDGCGHVIEPLGDITQRCIASDCHCTCESFGFTECVTDHNPETEAVRLSHLEQQTRISMALSIYQRLLPQVKWTPLTTKVEWFSRCAALASGAFQAADAFLAEVNTQKEVTDD